MEKTYTVNYKVYFNDRLKKVLFHDKLTYPLYIQITFNRQSIFFKSYYFDLFSKPKFAAHISGKTYGPDIKDVIEKEESLVEFIIDKNYENFSLDVFKSEYIFYSRDLLDMMEPDFLDYLYTFFYDEGLPFFAETVKNGAFGCKLFDLVREFKSSLNQKLYYKLWENCFDYGIPYLALAAFNEKPRQTLLKSFTVMEWKQFDTIDKFVAFCEKTYPGKRTKEFLDKIENWISKNVS